MKITSPKVSVIIPFYNRRDWLVEAVESVLGQSYKNIEIIVINDGSKEDVSEFVRIYQGKIRYFFKENGGPGSARNFGIEKAAGEYIAFLDSDDFWCENKLEKQVALMNMTDAIWSHTSYSLFQDREPHKVYKRIDASDYQGMVFPKCLLSSPIATPCVMIKASYLKENPKVRFSEKMRYGQDSYLWMSLAVNNPLRVVPEALTNVRIRGSNVSQRARTQLYAKGHLWEHIRQNQIRYYGKMNFVIKTAYKMCFCANKMLELLEKTRIINDTFLEYLSKVLYLFPYVALKSFNILFWKKK